MSCKSKTRALNPRIDGRRCCAMRRQKRACASMRTQQGRLIGTAGPIRSPRLAHTAWRMRRFLRRSGALFPLSCSLASRSRIGTLLNSHSSLPSCPMAACSCPCGVLDKPASALRRGSTRGGSTAKSSSADSRRRPQANLGHACALPNTRAQ